MKISIYRYINYARARCGPRLSRDAGEKLKSKYVLMRSQTKEVEEETDKRIAIPITVRQLEAVIRYNEPFSLYKHFLESPIKGEPPDRKNDPLFWKG